MYSQKDILVALHVFEEAPDKEAIGRASGFLTDFQHSAEAWAICNALLLAPDAPLAARIFASQTFRTKVTYDLHQLDDSGKIGLRDTLLTALGQYYMGPKTIQVQLCLALAGTALQLPQWTNSIQSVIERFGRDPQCVSVLLEFLKVLPEEINSNTRIPISDEEFRTRVPLLLSDNAQPILELLIVYIQASGVSSAIQSQVFQCLRSWINAGEILAIDVANTPFLQFSFDALASDDLFDTAVDLICDLIHETQEVYDNEPVIKMIMDRLVPLRTQLLVSSDDSDRIRGHTRIFAEAGENYRQLIIQHPGTFFPIVEALVDCTAYKDLDIVPITFHFWYRLAQAIGKRNEVSPLFLQAYQAVLEIIIRHLHFPPDATSLTGQEIDDFRSFRHVMGDTLKDCCYILGSDNCLSKAYDMVKLVVDSEPTTGMSSWQDIEAPLFAMRSMGAEVNVRDELIVPKIMDLIPTLPSHPRIRYAAMLVISRYTEWINEHPSYIPFQLSYLSSGFDNPDSEVSAAAAQAMKYLCKDCKMHLTDSLPQLRAFINTMGPKLSQDDRLQIYEAIAYIISCLPVKQAAPMLRLFSFEILERIHTVPLNGATPSKEDLRGIADQLEQLEVLLQIVDTFGEELPDICQNVHIEAWSLFDPLLKAFGPTYFLTERITRVLRFGMQFFGSAAVSIIPSVLGSLTASFEETGFSSCMWIAGKIVQRFGGQSTVELQSAVRAMFERMSLRVSSLLQTSAAADLPDVVEDYLRLSQAMLDFAPESFFSGSSGDTVFMTCLMALTLIHSDIIFAALELLRMLFDHNALLAKPVSSSPYYPAYAANIKDLFALYGYRLLAALFAGLIGNFPEESTSAVIVLFRCVAKLWPRELLAWLPELLQTLPDANFSAEIKNGFFGDCNSAISTGNLDKVKQAVTSLFRAARKVRERRDINPR